MGLNGWVDRCGEMGAFVRPCVHACDRVSE